MRKVARLGALVVVAGLLFSCAGGWTEFRSLEGGFSIDMPGTPKKQTESVPTAAGTITAHLFTQERMNDGYMAGYSDFPKQLIKASPPATLLKGGRDGAVANVGGKLLGDKMITLDGHPGIEFDFEVQSKGIRSRARVYLVDNRLYQTVVYQSQALWSEKQADRFLDSFRLRLILK